MEYAYAKRLIQWQERQISRVNGMRIFRNGYEYRLTWYGGFACYVGIDRREVGKRNFKYFSGIGASDCITVGKVLDKAQNEIERKVRA